MAQALLFSFFFLRRLSATRPLFLPQLLTAKPLSSLSPAQTNTNPSTPDPRSTSLSARMSFVFDQIDAIEKERAEKDETLNRIRAWRESKKMRTNPNDGVVDAFQPKPSDSSSVKTEEKKEESGGLMSKEVELVHPWPEWIEFMERLVQQNYFDHKRKDEGKMLEDSGFRMEEVEEEGLDFTRDWKTVQTACLNFGKDRFDILRSLSRHDIQILVGYGCPSADKKVVFSAKLLRKYVHLDEGDVCSSCKLRNSCERGYLLTNKEDEARTIDVVRVLLTYGFDPVNGSVINESLRKMKSVKTVVRKLLHEVVKLSAVPIDPNLPPPVIKRPPPKVKQPPPPPKKRVGRDDIEMKMGDWICPKCDFMNFAKNTVCRQCDAKRPRRQLLPGEWECPECNFLNYRRNTVCFHCEHKRPPDEFMENQLQDRQRGTRSRPEKVPNRDAVCNAWNFDFDDNESDGADVAAFEYADSHRMDEDFALGSQVQGDNFRGIDADPRAPRVQERDYYDHGHKKLGTGFDDFDEEEGDDIDSYELDTHGNSQAQKVTSVDFSDVEGGSDSEDVEDFDQGRFARENIRSPNKPFKGNRRRSSLSGSDVNKHGFDSDEDLPVHSTRKSSSVAELRSRSRGRKDRSYGSDDDYGLNSDSDDYSDLGGKGKKHVSWNRDFKRIQLHESGDDSLSGLDSDDECISSGRERFKRGKSSLNRRGGHSKNCGQFSGDLMLGNGFSGSRGSRGNGRGFQRDDKGGRRMNGRSGYGNRQHRGSNDFYGKGDTHREFDDERYTRPRVNVR